VARSVSAVGLMSFANLVFLVCSMFVFFFFSSRRRHTRSKRDWSSDVCSSDLAQMYNRFSGVQLPDAFAFFSGKRLAPIMSATAMVGAAAVLFFVWPVVYGWLVSFGEFISSLKA